MMKTPEEAAREYAKKIWKNGRTYRSRIGYSAEDFLAGLAIVGAMAVDAEKEPAGTGMESCWGDALPADDEQLGAAGGGGLAAAHL